MTDDRVADDVFGLVGETLHGKYRVDRVIGEGGFGVVYRGFHLSFEQPIAIKCLKIPSHFTAEARAVFLDRFREEGKHLAKLGQHGAVTRVYDFAVGSSVDGVAVPYLVLEWLDGKELSRVLTERGALRETEAIALLRPAIEALAFAHQLGIAHRDLKPENLFLAQTPLGQVLKVLDFGIAKVMQEGDRVTQVATKTSSGFRAFTPGYAAPEQLDARTFGATGPWTDVHAAGLMLGEMVAGRSVVDSSSVAALFAQLTGPERPTPRRAGAEVSDAYEAMCARALALRRSDRFPDAGALLAAMDALTLPALPARPLGLAKPVETADAFAPTQVPMPLTLEPAPVSDEVEPVPRTLRDAPVWAAVTSPRRSGAVAKAMLLVLLGAFIAIASWLLLWRDRDPLGGQRSASHADETDETDGDPVVRSPRGDDEVCSDFQACENRCDEADIDSCDRMVEFVLNGKEGPKTKDGKARVYQKACDARSGYGCTLAGTLEPLGSSRCVAYFRRGCDLSHADGCRRLGMQYEYGHTGRRDVDKADELYRHCCFDMEDESCCAGGGLLWAPERGATLDEERAKMFFLAACAVGGRRGYCAKAGVEDRASALSQFKLMQRTHGGRRTTSPAESPF